MMQKFSKLSRAEMRNISGGNPPPENDGKSCFAQVTCSNGQVIPGYVDCTDDDEGSATDIICAANFANTHSTSCDCLAG